MIVLQLAINGVLATKGEAAFYRFKAKKDQNLNFEVFARRLGSPIDSVVTVYGPKGNSLGTNDDAAGNPDSAVRVKIPDDARAEFMQWFPANIRRAVAQTGDRYA